MNSSRSALLFALGFSAFACSAESNERIAETELRYSYEDARAPAQALEGFEAAKLPQFVAVTFDDNFYVDGIEWANGFFELLENPSGSGRSGTFDGTKARTTFYSNGTYADWDNIPAAWKTSATSGHEIANHTQDHSHGAPLSIEEWQSEITTGESSIVNAGVVASTDDIVGFRSPYLEYGDNGFSALVSEGYLYDTSIQGCWATAENGSNCYFPYTLDAGSPDNATMVAKFGELEVKPHAGLWEVPVHALIVPPDELATKYGFDAGLRDRVPLEMNLPSYYEKTTGKISPLDFTLMVDAQMEPNEVLATLKYTFDLHREGNHAPLVFVAHTHLYSSSTSGAAGTTPERRKAIEDFVTYALGFSETRMRPVKDIITFMRAPIDLEGNGPKPPVATGGTGGTGGTTSPGGGTTSGSGGSLGGSTNPSDEPSETPASCSCRTVGTSSSSSSLAPLALVVLVFGTLLRRRSSALSKA